METLMFPRFEHTTSPDLGASKRRRPLRLLGAAAVTVALVAGLPGTAGADDLPSNVNLEQWRLSPNTGWTGGNLQAGYAEGDVVPFRLDVAAAGNGTWEFTICRDYQDGDDFGYLYLDQYDTTFSPGVGAPIQDTEGAIAVAADGATTVAIDSVVDPDPPVQGDCEAGEAETQVAITISGHVGGDDVYVLWGGHAAAPGDPGVGAGHGASAYPGSSLHMALDEPNKDVSAPIAPRGSAREGSLTVTKHVVGGQGGEVFSVDIDCSDNAFDSTGNALSEDNPVVVTDIPVGTTCTVSEDADPLFDTSYDPAAGQVTIDADGETVAVTNTRRSVYGEDPVYGQDPGENPYGNNPGNNPGPSPFQNNPGPVAEVPRVQPQAPVVKGAVQEKPAVAPATVVDDSQPAAAPVAELPRTGPSLLAMELLLAVAFVIAGSAARAAGRLRSSPA